MSQNKLFNIEKYSYYFVLFIIVILSVTFIKVTKWSIFLVLVIFLFFDIYITNLIYKQYKKPNFEINPIGRFFMKRFGGWWWLPFSFFGFLLFFFLISTAESLHLFLIFIGAYLVMLRNNYIIYKQNGIRN